MSLHASARFCVQQVVAPIMMLETKILAPNKENPSINHDFIVHFPFLAKLLFFFSVLLTYRDKQKKRGDRECIIQNVKRKMSNKNEQHVIKVM